MWFADYSSVSTRFIICEKTVDSDVGDMSLSSMMQATREKEVAEKGNDDP
jgi:hypothetical protein